MGGARIVEDGEYYVVYAGGRIYRLPKQYVEPISEDTLVSRKTGYRFKATSSGLHTLPPLWLEKRSW
ncbi:MAG: hypothetical protein GSR84_04575 [Desulfurococcales archaeon]|nr:hypothetical protein [Desulfurococcales archaeon]